VTCHQDGLEGDSEAVPGRPWRLDRSRHSSICVSISQGTCVSVIGIHGVQAGREDWLIWRSLQTASRCGLSVAAQFAPMWLLARKAAYS